MPQGLFDPQGHLTPAGLAALAGAPVGKAPADLAAHVAACPRCQDLMLAGTAGGAPVRRERREPPPAGRIWFVIGAAVLLLLFILIALHRLAGG